MNSQRIVSLLRWLAAALALAAIVTVYQRWLHVNQTTVALTLLLLVLVLASKWGLRYAVVASLAAASCYNFYFLPPVGTFTINDPQNWIALLAFLVTAVVASRLSARIRAEALEARRRQAEVEVLFQLSRELLLTEKVNELIHSVPASIARAANASAVLLYLSEGERVFRAGDAEVALPLPEVLEELLNLPAAARLDAGKRVAVPLRTGVRPRGVLLMEDVNLSDGTLDAIGGLVSISIDRAQALEEVTRGEAAKESDRLRSVMLDAITHELRTPLASIKSAVTSLLASGEADPAQQREGLKLIDQESDRLNHLVSQAVEMAQLDTREIQMRLAPQPVSALTEGIAEACGGLIATRNLRMEIQPDLPAVQADLQWIRKVLCNLLDNAAKYSASSEPIVLTAELRGTGVCFSVADRGLGIDVMEQPLIFDKFYRVRSQVERVPGTGMGLAICRAIVEAHGGEITVVSQAGKGSVFSFSLAVAGESLAAPSPGFLTA